MRELRITPDNMVQPHGSTATSARQLAAELSSGRSVTVSPPTPNVGSRRVNLERVGFVEATRPNHRLVWSSLPMAA